MATRYEIETELRRIWGAEFETKIDAALTAYDRLGEDARARIDVSGDMRDIAALSALGSEAYSNPRHAQHTVASQEVNALFERISDVPDPNDIPL